MGEWDSCNAKNLVRILKCFELCSGLKVNLSKSRLMGLSVSCEEVRDLARWLKCKEDSLPFKYLGLPVGGKMSNVSSWQPIIDKVKKRLSTWKTKSLSIGGRLCLCKAVLGSLSTYFFSLYSAPKKVLLTLESLRRRFFLGEVESSKRINWVAWNKTLRNKESGGLGIGSLHALNLAMLRKWWWREKTEPDNIWTKIIRSCSGDNPRKSGEVWRGIKSIETQLSGVGINLNSLFQRKNDEWVWPLDPSSKYTVSSLRKLIDCTMLPQADQETFWIKWVTNKVNVHLWRTLINRLPTLDNLHARGVQLPSIGCYLCNAKSESLDHVFTDCSSARLISAHLSLWTDWWSVNETTVSGLWLSIDQGSSNKVRRLVKKLIAAAFFWILWKQRNDKAFGRAIKKEKEKCEKIQFVAFNWIKHRAKFGKILSWESWCSNPINAVTLCCALAPR